MNGFPWIAAVGLRPFFLCWIGSGTGNIQVAKLLHVAVFLSCAAISITMGRMCFRFRKELPVGWMTLLIGTFVAVAGLVPLVQMFVVLHPLEQGVRIFTAAAAVVTAGVLPLFSPRLTRALAKSEVARRNERRFLAASNSSNESFYILASVRDSSNAIVDFRFVFVNTNGARLLYRTPSKVEGQLLCELEPINRTHGFFDCYKRVVETGEPSEEEFPIDSAGINASWLHHRVVKLDDGVAISASNVSARKQAELDLMRSLSFSRSLVNHSPFPVIAIGLDGKIAEINPATEQMLWYTNDEVRGKHSPLIFLDEAEVTARAHDLSELLGYPVSSDISVLTAYPTIGQTDEHEWTFLRKDGSRLMVQLSVTELRDDDNFNSGWLGVAYDITERKRTEEYISHLAHHDALTGLPMRTLLHDRVEVALQRAKRNSHKVALLMVDMDNFKRVNDSMGHSVGDEVLVIVGRRLQESVRKSDTVARMGGDEFIVLLDDLHNEEEAERIAEKLVAAVGRPITLMGEEHPVSVSVGVCLYPDGGADAEVLLRNADEAMYFAKSEGRNMYQIFSPDMAAVTARRRLLESALEQALARKEFEVFYQPQVSFHTRKVTGIEALLRWKSATLGNVSPAEFIPVAEQTGLIVAIGEWVLRTSCHDTRALELQMGRPITIAVNISPRQFQQERLPDVVQQILTESGLDPAHLELEITENILVNDSQKAMRVLDRVRALGLRIAIDDFGTGFSSMSYILRFNVDRLKIDQSFIRNGMVEPNGSITRAIIALGRGLKINVVAEGVETESVAEFLREENCDEAQGYYFARPMRVGDLQHAIGELEALHGE